MNLLIPTNKDDQEAIQHLQAASQEQVLTVAKELLEWIEDGNWPVSYPIGQVLSPYVNQLQGELLPILSGYDAIWKMWCIYFIMKDAPVPQLAPAYLVELTRIVEHPTLNEKLEGALEAAQEVLAFWRSRE